MTDKLGESNNNLIRSLNHTKKHKQMAGCLEVLGIEKYEQEATNKLHEEFQARVRQRDGKEYVRDGVRVVVTAVDRYLTEKDYKRLIMYDGEFKSSNQIRVGRPDHSGNEAKAMTRDKIN